MNDVKKLASIIITKVIDANKTEEENIEHLSQYLRNRQYEDISTAISAMRRASKTKEDEILKLLEYRD